LTGAIVAEKDGRRPVFDLNFKSKSLIFKSLSQL